MKNPQDLKQERYNERWIPHFRNLRLHLTQISKPPNLPQHTQHLSQPSDHSGKCEIRAETANTNPIWRDSLQNSHIHRRQQKITGRDRPGWCNKPHLPENEMQREWQMQTAQKPITKCKLEHYERRMMMETHEAHLVEERSRWSERRKMRSVRRDFGFGLPTYLCRVYTYIYGYVRICIRVSYAASSSGWKCL